MTVGSTPTDFAAFLDWWTRVAGGDGARFTPPADVRHACHVYLELRAAPAGTPRPPAAAGPGWAALTVDGDTPGRGLVLWVPHDWAPESGPVPCGRTLSWLGAEPYGRWTELRVDPFCDVPWKADESGLWLYRVPGEAWPLVAASTQGPHGVRSELLRYDPGEGRYVRAAVS